MDRISRISRISRIRIVVAASTAAFLAVGSLHSGSDGPALLAVSNYYWLSIVLLLGIAAGHIAGKITGRSVGWPSWWSEIAVWTALVFFSFLYALTGDRMAWLVVAGWLFFWAMRRLRAVRRTAREAG